jgi:hypothetical protein
MLPTSGSISLSQINTELGRAATSTVSLDSAENGSYGGINQNSTVKPSSGNPARMSEWQGYNHACGQVGISGHTNGIVCNGNTLTLVGTGMSSYSWSVPGVGTVSGGYLELTPGAAGYPAVNSSVTYTVTGTSTGCSSSLSRTVTNKPLPSVVISPSSVTINQGQSTTLTASGASTYSWSTGATGTSITVSPSSTTTYTVTGTSVDGCSAQNSRTVTVIAATTTTTCPPNGTLLGTYCSGETLMGQYADGNCGSYDALIDPCHPDCGCEAQPCFIYEIVNVGEGYVGFQYINCAGALRQNGLEPGGSFSDCIRQDSISVIEGDPRWLEARPFEPCE